jgi:hypothetical protein
MPRLTKDDIADELYGACFDDLYGAQKAVVTRKFNDQKSTSARVGPVVEAWIGRVGVNGTKHCLMQPGQSVGDLLNQAAYSFDNKKETIAVKSTGQTVSLSDPVLNGETYVISVEIKSA